MSSNPDQTRTAFGGSSVRKWQVLALFAGPLLAYSSSLGGELLWDDTFLVGSNPFFRSFVFVFEVFRHWLFPDAHAAYYRPVQNWSYMLDYLLWHGSTFGYHLTNILLHGTASVFLFLLLIRLFSCWLPDGVGDDSTGNRSWLAFAVAGVWAVHPIHNAAVAYIAGRADSLAAVFALAAWLVYIRSEKITQRVQLKSSLLWAAAWLLGLLALCSKEIAIVWCGLFVAVEIPLLKPKRKGWALAGAIGLLLLTYSGMRHLPGVRSSPEVSYDPFAGRVLLMLRALGDYTRLMFWPVNLHMCREVFTNGAYGSNTLWARAIGMEYLSLLGFGTIAVFGIGAFKSGPGRSMRRYGAVWFLIGFLPISNLFPLNAQVAEHWIYMPSIGFLVFLAGCFAEVPGQFRRAGWALLCFATVALSFQTWNRSQDWTSGDRLYWSTIQSGGADPRVIINFANIYASKGKLDKAERLLRYVCEHWPEYSAGPTQLGRVLLLEGRAEEAERLLTKVQRDETEGKAPKVAGSWKADLNLAVQRAKGGKLAEALELVDGALSRYPGVSDVVRYKIQLLQQMGRTEDALKLASGFAKEQWWNLDVQVATAKLMLACGRQDDALRVLQHAAWLDLWNADPVVLAAQIELSCKRPEAALHWAKSAVWRDPKPSSYLLLGAVYQQLHRDAEAQQALREASELQNEINAG